MTWIAKHNKENVRRKKESLVCNMNADINNILNKELNPKRYYSKVSKSSWMYSKKWIVILLIILT